MFSWLHHILNPHCPECKAERDEAKVCQSCETLKHQLELALMDKQRLIDTLTRFVTPQPVAAPASIPIEALKPKMLHWKSVQQQLEAEDRKTAQLLREKAQEEAKLHSVSTMQTQTRTDEKLSNEIETLEKELGV